MNTSATREMHTGGQLALQRGQRTLLAEVMPLKDDGLPDREGICGAVIFLIDPQVSRVVSTEGIARIFGLTASEAAVAESLANGLNVAEIAEQRNTSADTIRKQLKAVFSKTGSTSQLELLRLAVKANPPIRKKRLSD